MLTKTKKWFVAFVLAFAAIFLVACNGDEKEVAPEKLEIFIEGQVEENAILVGGETQLSVDVTPANASKKVEWSSSKPEIAIVNQDGKVVGLKGGVTTITATSKVDDKVKTQVEITVLVDLNPTTVLIKAMEYVKENMPKYVDDRTQLPDANNDLVEVEYFDDSGLKLTNRIYEYDYVKDTYVTLECVLKYRDEEVNFPVTIQIVSDVKFNDFIAIEEAREAVDRYLQFYKTYKVYENIPLPKNLSELYEWLNQEKEVRQEVNFSWKSLGTNVLGHDGTYIRPNDDTGVRLEVIFLSGNNSGIARHDLVTKGYTDDEKVELLLDTILELPEEIEGVNLLLPVTDSKFNTTIIWKSSNEEVLNTNGRMDPYLEVEETVTLTATIVYKSPTGKFDFERDIEYEILVKPAANDAQKVALDLTNKFDGEDFPHYFPYGLTEDNKIPLPTEVPDGEFEGTKIEWTCAEEGLFDENWVIQKQYLRYHETQLTFTVKIGDDSASGQVSINTGVAKVSDTKYIGGNMFSRSASANPSQPWDELHQLNTDDGPNGVVGSNLDVYGWSGYTTYVDIDGVRYQWFHAGWYTSVAYSDDELTLTEDNAIQGGLLSVSGHGGTNRQTLFVNNTDKDLKFPMAYYMNEIPENVTFELGLTKSADGKTLDRSELTVDAYYYAMVANAEGKVIWGSGDERIQNILKAEKEKEVEDGAPYVLPDYIEVPAGGFMICTRYAGPTGGLQKILFQKDLQFTIERFGVKPVP